MGRRMATLLVALALTFALAACGSNDASNGSGRTGAATSSGSTTATGDSSMTDDVFPVTVTGTADRLALAERHRGSVRGRRG